jgi:sirohydrochlorin ferrochelatase
VDIARSGLLVIGHGSRRDEANLTLLAVADALAERGRWHRVQPAFLEIARPGIRAGYAALVAAGCTAILVHPYFLFAGNHTAYDIPAELRAAQDEHGVPWTLTAPLGLHPALIEVVEQRIEEAMAAGHRR